MERKCPICGKIYSEYPALSRRDNKTYICPDCGTAEALKDYFTPTRLSPYERTKRQVYATGNKWAIENFHATHD